MISGFKPYNREVDRLKFYGELAVACRRLVCVSIICIMYISAQQYKETTMASEIILNMMVAGCPTTCLHCVRSGRAYPSMSLDNIRIAADVFVEYGKKNGIQIFPAMMNEHLEHENPVEVARILQVRFDTFNVATVATDGVSLGKRPDWEDIISGLQSLGTKQFWFSFHGHKGAHDEVVQRPGAYDELVEAVRRVREMKVGYGTNVFLNTGIIGDFKRFVRAIDELEIGRQVWTVAFYIPTARLRSYERLRPGYSDIEPHFDDILSRTETPPDDWKRTLLTEQGFIQEILGDESTEESKWIIPESSAIELVCTSNLDIYDGDVHRLATKYGNLNDTGIEAIMDAVLEARSNHTYLNLNSDHLYFDKEEMPSVQELAHAVGDADSDKIHAHQTSMRNRWLDLYLKDFRRL